MVAWSIWDADDMGRKKGVCFGFIDSHYETTLLCVVDMAVHDAWRHHYRQCDLQHSELKRIR